MRQWYARKSAAERRAWVLARDPEKVRAADTARYERDKPKRMAVAAAHADPAHKAANTAVSNALRDGRLTKGPCEMRAHGGCRGRIEAHHDDYDAPLDVRWLCKEHHMQAHDRSLTPF